MPSTENLYSHPQRSALAAAAALGAGAPAARAPGRGRSSSEAGGAVHSRSSSLTNLGAAARARLQRVAHSQFVRFIEDNDAQDKDENDIYRAQNAQNPSDQVFTFERWAKHRNSMRYAKHLAHMFTSRVFKQLLGPVLAVMALALSVGIYETLVNNNLLPGHWPHVTLALGQGFNLTAFALSLLLVFRTNSSYDRWWEGRKLWGGVVNRTRDIVRQSLVFFHEEDVHLKELLARWTMAFPKVLMVHLRENADLQKEVSHLLTAPEVAALMAAAHRPNFVLQVMAETIRAARPHELARMRMDENLTFFEDAMGSCERILRTPIPLSYTRHTSRFLLVWLILLPFTLWAAYSWFSVLLSGIFAFLMFGIDEIGVQIEEPFGILPLEAAGATIERNIRELLARSLDVGLVVHQPERLPGGGGSADSASASPGASGASSPGPLPGAGGGAAGELGHGVLGGGSAASLISLATSAEAEGDGEGEGEGDEFGEMMAAAAAPQSPTAAGKQGGGAAAPRAISLSASAGEAAAAALGAPPASPSGQRRVQFGGQTIIDVRSSDEGSPMRGGRGGRGPPARQQSRQPTQMEMELASGAAQVSPRAGSWLYD